MPSLAEPVIAYGPFNTYTMCDVRPGAVITNPDHVGFGFGVINLPEGCATPMFLEPTHPDLQYYLQHARSRYQEDLLAEEFDAIPNKLELLRGCFVYTSRLMTEGLSLDLCFSRFGSSHSLLFTFEDGDAVIYGRMKREDIRSWLSSAYYPQVMAVDPTDNTIVIAHPDDHDDHVKFSMLPRYAEVTEINRIAINNRLSSSQKAMWLRHYRKEMLN